MRPLAEQNFYEVLEISLDTTLQEIERAYRIARATYQPTSTATYSVFSEEENGEILRRVEEAYSVLSDARLRREYDARLRREGLGDRVRPRASAPSPPAPREVIRKSAQIGTTPEVDFGLADGTEPADGIYDGPVLRRIRMSRGIELEEISALTRVNEGTLQFIESNQYHKLPAPVYLRGFVKEFAKCLRLDPQTVADGYMKKARCLAGGNA